MIFSFLLWLDYSIKADKYFLLLQWPLYSLLSSSQGSSWWRWAILKNVCIALRLLMCSHHWVIRNEIKFYWYLHKNTMFTQRVTKTFSNHHQYFIINYATSQFLQCQKILISIVINEFEIDCIIYIIIIISCKTIDLISFVFTVYGTLCLH